MKPVKNTSPFALPSVRVTSFLSSALTSEPIAISYQESPNIKPIRQDEKKFRLLLPLLDLLLFVLMCLRR